jgi:hypothetical protein
MNYCVHHSSGDISMLDLTSFGLGFLVAPVAYVLVGAAAYSAYCTAKWLVRPAENSSPFAAGAPRISRG